MKMRNTLVGLLAASLLIGSYSTAFAHGGHHYEGARDHSPRHERHHERRHHRDHQRHREVRRHFRRDAHRHEHRGWRHRSDRWAYAPRHRHHHHRRHHHDYGLPLSLSLHWLLID